MGTESTVRGGDGGYEGIWGEGRTGCFEGTGSVLGQGGL